MRLVLLLGVFINEIAPLSATPARLKAKLEPLGVLPITRQDIINLMVNPFTEKFQPILEFARVEVGLKQKEIAKLVEEVAVKCLEEGCKVCYCRTILILRLNFVFIQGKMVRKLYDNFPSLHDVIVNTVIRRYRLDVDKLPPSEDEEACRIYRAPLCREFNDLATDEETSDAVIGPNAAEVAGNEEVDDMSVDEDSTSGPAPLSSAPRDAMPELASSLI